MKISRIKIVFNAKRFANLDVQTLILFPITVISSADKRIKNDNSGS